MSDTVIMLGIVIACCIGVSLWNLNSIRASTRTGRDRVGLIQFCSKQRCYDAYERDIKDVDFEAHHNAVARFSNPWRLYSTRLLHFLGQHAFISLSEYKDAIEYAQARESEILDRIERARKAIEETVQESDRRTNASRSG